MRRMRVTPVTLQCLTHWDMACPTPFGVENAHKVGPSRALTHMENAILAPAAGAGVGKLLADLLLADPGFIPLMRKTALDCLEAMSPRRWDKETETWINDPDFRIRAQMFFGLLAHMEGEPIKRIIHQHLGGSGAVDPLAALQESPELREAAKRMLEKAEWRHSGKGEHKRPKKVQPETLDVG